MNINIKRIISNLAANDVLLKAVYYTLRDIESEVLKDSGGIIDTQRVIFLPIRFDSSDDAPFKTDPKRHRIDALNLLCKYHFIRFHNPEYPFNSDRLPISSFPSGRIWIYINSAKQFKEARKLTQTIYDEKFRVLEISTLERFHKLKNGKLLDEHIAFRSGNLLVHQERNNLFTTAIPLTRQESDLINYLCKHKGHAASLKELTEDLEIAHSSQIIGLIKRINKKCGAEGIMPLIEKSARGRYGFNANLSEINKIINNRNVKNTITIPT